MLAQEIEALIEELQEYAPSSVTGLSRQDQKALAEIEAYEFSGKYAEMAYTALRGVLAGIRKNRPELAQYPLTALIDTYHQDRASRAAYLLRAGKFLQFKDIPSAPPGQRSGSYQRRMSQLGRYESGTPEFVLPRVVEVLEEVLPDEMREVTYTQMTRRYDPIIYAIYGPYWVEVAQWWD